MSKKPNLGDIVDCGDYRYEFIKYGFDDKLPETEGWNVIVKNNMKKSYENILSVVNGYPVKFMLNTFRNCVHMKKLPELPSTIVAMPVTCMDCVSLENIDSFCNLEHLIVMSYTFANCYSINENIKIPKSVKVCF